MKEQLPQPKKNEQLAEKTEQLAELLGKLGADEKEDEKIEFDSEPGDTLWKSPKLTDKEHYQLKEQLLNLEESKKREMGGKIQEQVKDVDLYEAETKFFAEKIKNFNKVTEELKVLKPQEKELETKYDGLFKEITNLSNLMISSELISNDGTLQHIQNREELSQKLASAKRKDNLVDKISFGMVHTKAGDRFIDGVARELNYKRRKNIEKELLTVGTQLLRIKEQVEKSDQEVAQFLDFLKTKDGERFMKIKDLEEKIEGRTRKVKNSANLDLLN